MVIYGTALSIQQRKNEVLVQLMNQGGRSSLVQSWIDDGDTSLPPEKIKVPFLLTPPVAKVAGDSGQQIKIKKCQICYQIIKKVCFISTCWIFHQTIQIVPVKCIEICNAESHQIILSA